jgi:hypothetical protein
MTRSHDFRAACGHKYEAIDDEEATHFGLPGEEG